MHYLDQWLTYIDTDQILPLFETSKVDYRVPKLDETDWTTYPGPVTRIVWHKDLSELQNLRNVGDLRSVLSLLNAHDERMFLRQISIAALELEANSTASHLSPKLIAKTLLQYLPEAVYLVTMFLQSQSWKTHKPVLQETLTDLGPLLCRHIVLSERNMGGVPSWEPLALVLRELKCMSLQHFAELVELVSLTFSSSESALDLLLGVLEPEVSRLLVGRPFAVRQFASSLFGIALDHIDEASNSRTSTKDTLRLHVEGFQEGFRIVKSTIRVDSQLFGLLRTGDHVLFTVSNAPQNAPTTNSYCLDAIVVTLESGTATFRCLHEPPSYVTDCAWRLTYCGSFVTSNALIDSVLLFYSQHEACCKIYESILGTPSLQHANLSDVELPTKTYFSLNDSQNRALAAALRSALTFIWGPPGTGKTHTIVVILENLLTALPECRFLITAPTHNAVDNLLRRFIRDAEAKKCGVIPVRVSTQVRLYLTTKPFSY